VVLPPCEGRELEGGPECSLGFALGDASRFSRPRPRPHDFFGIGNFGSDDSTQGAEETGGRLLPKVPELASQLEIDTEINSA
jgi:hypothetical protein